MGAVLLQRDSPIYLIPRTYSASAENYAANEQELLAIVLILKTLRQYLNAIQDIKSLPDHQPLIFDMPENNPDSKMKRWNSFIEKFFLT